MFKATENSSNPKVSRNSNFREDSARNSFFKVQTKLSVGRAGDSYEREADSVANNIVRQSENKRFNSRDTFFPAIPIQKRDPLKPKKELQKKSFENENFINKNLENKLKSTKGSGNFLKGKAKAEMERGFGTDFSNVKIHNNSISAQMNNELGAHAFTNGNDIYFNSGKFNPGSKEGKHLLAHELTHTLQQSNDIRRYRDKKATNFGLSDTASLKEDTFDVSKDKNKKPWIHKIIISLNKTPTKDVNGSNYYVGNLVAKYYSNKHALSDLSFPVSAGSDAHKTKAANNTVFRIEGQGYMSGSYSDAYEPNPSNKKYNKDSNSANMHYAVFFKGAQAIHVGDLNIASHGCVHVEDFSAMTQLNYHAVNGLTVVILDYK